MHDFKHTQKKYNHFWKEKDLLGKLQKKNKEGKAYFYLDGPPYANFVPHVGHVRNTVYKDFGIRLAFMKGYNVLFQPGFDTHGLPVENMVEKKLNLKSKKDIEKTGAEHFTKACKDWAVTNKDLWLEVYDLLGSWYVWKEPYLTYNNDYLESGWWSFKQMWNKKLVYEGQKPVFWCPKCETALSGYEVTDSYIMKSDPSIIIKFKLKGKDEYLVVFTTTPWTLISNTAIVAKSDEVYAKVETVFGNLILAKKRLDLLADLGIGFKLIEEFEGKKLDGVKYEPILDVPMQRELSKHSGSHKIYMSIPILKERVPSKVAAKKNVGESGDIYEHFVSVEEGTGLVHTAPGHGKTDNEIGQHYKLAEASPLDDSCNFTELAGEFKGRFVKDADEDILKLLEEQGKLLYHTTAEHKYPVCWRCKSPLIFRMSNQWFVKIDRKEMVKLNEKVKWLPEYAGERFESWVLNAEDWNISRQRYWGIPIPVWKCECGKSEIISSFAELKKKSVEKLNDNFDLHNASKVKIRCSCGKEMNRIKDIFDVWFDSGIAPWASLGYPAKNKELFETHFPVSRINESQDQVRGWFYYLLYCAQAIFGKQSYHEVSMPGWVLDSKGQKMSKSLGNVIFAKDALEKYGADSVRFYYMWDIAPYETQKFSMETIDKEVLKFFNVYLNLQNYVLSLETKYKERPLNKIEDEWIMSKFNTLILVYNKALDEFEYHTASRALYDFVMNDLSRTYVKLVRDRVAEGDEDVTYVLVKLMKDICVLMAPICPYITEDIFQQLKEKFKFEELSVHLCDWLVADTKMIDANLEEGFAAADVIVQNLLAKRDEAKINVRWPLASAKVQLKDEKVMSKVKKVESLIMKQVNVKKVEFVSGENSVELDLKMTKELEEEGFTRELMRRVQTLRKEAQLKKADKIKLYMHISEDLQKYHGTIVERCGVSELHLEKVPEHLKHKDHGEIRGKKFVLGF